VRCGDVLEVCSRGHPLGRQRAGSQTGGRPGQGHGWAAGGDQGHPRPAGRWRPGLQLGGGRRSGLPVGGRCKTGSPLADRVLPSTRPPPPLYFGRSVYYERCHLQFPYCTDHLPRLVGPHHQKFRDPRQAVLWGGGRRWVALRAIANPIQNRSRRRHNSRHEPLYGGRQHTQVRRVYGEGVLACQSV
jgi:hypothetical protein